MEATAAETAEKLVREAVEEHTGETGYSLTTEFRDIKADSLDVVEIVMIIEDKLGKQVEDKALLGTKTVGDVVKIIERYV